MARWKPTEPRSGYPSNMRAITKSKASQPHCAIERAHGRGQREPWPLNANAETLDVCRHRNDLRSANHRVIFRNLLVSGCVSSKTTRRNLVMAFYRPQDLGPIVPRDRSAIDQRPAYASDGNFSSLVVLLLVVAVAFGLYFL
jgi:hypothetical protein